MKDKKKNNHPTPPPVPPSRTVPCRLKHHQLVELDALARTSGMTRSALIQLAIARLLEKGL